MNQFFIFIILASSNLWALSERTIHVQGGMSSARTWMDYTSSAELNLKKLIELLDRSPSGNKLLREAQSKASLSGQTLLDVIKVGESSLTDTTLVRKFSPHSPEEVVYESRSVVYLNRGLAWDDALLDLAHELTHYVYRENFNPYVDSFNAPEFIKGTIEGSGGEVQAFLTECRVLKELFSTKVQTRSQCTKITNEHGELSHSKAVDLFYHVGDYYKSFSAQLAKRDLSSFLTRLKGDKIDFISSAYGVPYPMAALMEYDLVVNKVCENDKKRLAYMQAGVGRGPASASEGQQKLHQLYSARCKLK
jgi:hypothetical protein